MSPPAEANTAHVRLTEQTLRDLDHDDAITAPKASGVTDQRLDAVLVHDLRQIFFAKGGC